ncbi:MAG: hypothetical protein GY915_05055 [bacterium]|nr:hypothetical protein [bacterium]
MSTICAAFAGLGLALLLKGRLTLPAPAYLPFLMPSLITGFSWIFTLSFFNLHAYGTTAIICVHALMNTPLVALVCLQSFQSIPQETKNLSHMLRLSRVQSWILLEGHALKKNLPIVLVFILILCFHSLCIPLLLGGGPKGTTLELALYQSLRFETDLTNAGLIALAQITLSGALILMLYHHKPIATVKPILRPSTFSKRKRSWVFSSPLYGLYGFFLFHCFKSGDPSFLFQGEVWFATLSSLFLASSSVMVSLLLFVSLTLLSLRFQSPASKAFQQLLPLFFTTASPLTLCIPIFALFWPYTPDVLLIIFMHSLLVLPLFIVRVGPVLQEQLSAFSPLFLTLRLSKRDRLFILYKGIRPALHQSLGLGLCLCLGELGAVSLFSLETETLSTLLYGSLTKFSYDKALTVAGVLMTLCLILLSLSQKTRTRIL